MNEVIIFILLFVAGISNAIQDTINHHWDRCLFNRIKNKALWIWFRSDWIDRPIHPVWFIWDAWHFFKTFERVCYLMVIFWITRSLAIMLGAAIVLAIGFNIFYKKILIKDEND